MLRKLWTRFCLRGLHYSDRHEKLDSLYLLRDPWGMETEKEKFRFDETNRLIETHIGGVETLLEIGCGEGHQSQKLQQLSNTFYGLDVSERAVQRARERVDQGTFGVGDVFNCKMLQDVPRFDLVVACEVLYYMQDVSAAITRLSELGRWCFVTYYQGQFDKMDQYFISKPHVQTEIFQFEETSWKAVWWQNDK